MAAGAAGGHTIRSIPANTKGRWGRASWRPALLVVNDAGVADQPIAPRLKTLAEVRKALMVHVGGITWPTVRSRWAAAANGLPAG